MKAILLDMFIGGTGRTSTTLTWAMSELIKKPTLKKKAQDEVRGVIGKKIKVDEDDINQMKYLRCIIKETLRLHPPVPLLIPRENFTSTKIKGYDIPQIRQSLLMHGQFRGTWNFGMNQRSFGQRDLSTTQLNTWARIMSLYPLGLEEEGAQAYHLVFQSLSLFLLTSYFGLIGGFLMVRTMRS
ncbi:cytochrome P450 71A1-like [Papaver somniferum]|uniref:cytochrome P450 71A1-like n=1 Tax=Papaver somniferum TaxID=3469 RepID=UPI000E6FBB6C|nr:cytochrome P450 71A1-like [Papaver somniferum]